MLNFAFWTAAGTILTAFFTLLIAIFSYKSVREINKTILAQITFHVREQFDSDGIVQSMRILKSIEGDINKGEYSKILAKTQEVY